MAARVLLPIEFLRECFSYDPETGVLRWRHRPASHFPTDADAAGWNKQNAGSLAFPLSADGYHRSEVRHEGRRLRLTAGRVAYALHHGEQPPHIVDHEDGDVGVNRIANLRAADDTLNMWNRRRGKDRGDTPRGAYPAKNGRWYASVTQHRRKVHLGTFDTKWEAHEAFAAFVACERGEFNFTGPPVGVFA